ncbi:hypothetical protein HOP50_17g79950 [Chloropicon primus]|nr:hypothetical protein HOP50_17g79950 [Chloropicon primus]
MKCTDERSLWTAVLSEGEPLDRGDFKAIASQMSFLGRNGLTGTTPSSVKGRALGTLLRYVEEEASSFEMSDIEDTLEAFNDFGVRIPSSLGRRLVGAYLRIDQTEELKNIRRLMVASRSSMEERSSAQFEALMVELVERPLSFRSRRDLANSLWSLKVDGLQSKIKGRVIGKAIDKFVAACNEFPPHRDRESFANMLKQYSQVWFAVTKLPAKRLGIEVAEKLLRAMLRETADCPAGAVDPSHWVVVVDNIHKLNTIGHANQPRAAWHHGLGELLEEVVENFLSCEDAVEAKQAAVFLCASRYMQFIDRGKMEPLLQDLVRLFHSKLSSAGPKETGNVLGSLARLKPKNIPRDVVRDVLARFLETLPTAKKRNISQLMVGVAKHKLELSSEEIRAIMDRYFEDDSEVNSWHIGGLMWSLQKVNSNSNKSYLHSSDCLTNLLGEFVHVMDSDKVAVDPIHISQALQGLVIPHLRAVNPEHLKKVVMKLTELAGNCNGNCNSQVLSNSLSNLRKLRTRGNLGEVFDEETFRCMHDLYKFLICNPSKAPPPKVNEIAQAISAVSELGLPISSDLLSQSLEVFMKSYDKSDKAQFGGPSLSKIIFCLSKMEGVEKIDIALRYKLVEAYSNLPVEAQKRARGAKNARDDRFRILNHAHAFLRKTHTHTIHSSL